MKTAALVWAFLLVCLFAGAGESSRLSVYSAFVESENHELFAAFRKETGIEIRHVRISAGEAITRLVAERDNPRVSVMLGGSVAGHLRAIRDGVFEPYSSANIDTVDPALHDPAGIYTPITRVTTAFASNLDWLAENGIAAPTSWRELLDERFRDNIAIGQPAISGAAYAALTAVLRLFGEEEGFDYLKKLDRNVFQYAKTGAAPMRMAGLGEIGVAIGFDLDAQALMDEGYPLVVTYPEEGTGYELTCVSVVKGGPPEEAANARRFIDWLLEPATQTLLAQRFHRIPLNRNVERPDDVRVKLIPLDHAWAAEDRPRLLERFEREVRAQ